MQIAARRCGRRGDARELERFGLLAEPLGDDRAAQRELVERRARCRPRAASRRAGPRSRSRRAERELGARVERDDVAADLRRARGRRRARPGRACSSSSASRATSSHARGALVRPSSALLRARSSASSVSAGEVAAERGALAASTRNAAGGRARRATAHARARAAASRSPRSSARSSLVARSAVGVCRSSAARLRCGGGEQRDLVGGARAVRGFLVEPRGIGVAADRLVARASGAFAAGIVGSNASACSKLTCACAGVVELLLEDQRELEVQRAAIARVRCGRDLAIQQRRRRAPTRRAPSPRCAAGTRSPDPPARTRALP